MLPRQLIAFLTAMGLALSWPVAGLAQSGNSGIDQYIEQEPGAGGGKPITDDPSATGTGTGTGGDDGQSTGGDSNDDGAGGSRGDGSGGDSGSREDGSKGPGSGTEVDVDNPDTLRSLADDSADADTGGAGATLVAIALLAAGAVAGGAYVAFQRRRA